MDSVPTPSIQTLQMPQVWLQQGIPSGAQQLDIPLHLFGVPGGCLVPGRAVALVHPRSVHFLLSGLAVLGGYGVSAVGKLAHLVVAEKDWVCPIEAEKEAEDQGPDLTFRVGVGPHLDDVP